MSRLYADEQFPKAVSQLLRDMGHEILTVQEAGNANLGISDEDVLSFAIRDERAVITLNRQDFIKLHRANSKHFGIVVCTNDPNRPQMANRIDQAIAIQKSLRDELIRVVRPSR
jgi:predicted nuclease of predicted toxin-antitoxin system